MAEVVIDRQFTICMELDRMMGKTNLGHKGGTSAFTLWKFCIMTKTYMLKDHIWQMQLLLVIVDKAHLP